MKVRFQVLSDQTAYTTPVTISLAAKGCHLLQSGPIRIMVAKL